MRDAKIEPSIDCLLESSNQIGREFALIGLDAVELTTFGQQVAHLTSQFNCNS